MFLISKLEESIYFEIYYIFRIHKFLIIDELF